MTDEIAIVYLGRQFHKKGNFVFKVVDLRTVPHKEYYIDISHDFKGVSITEKY